MQFHRQCCYKTLINSNHDIEHADKLDRRCKIKHDLLDQSPTIKIILYRKDSTPNIKMPKVDIVCMFVLWPQATVRKSSPAPPVNSFDCSLNRHDITVYY
jgi:hypothetical protein